ncbi:MAG: septum formation initiator family protein [Acidobacteriota bacterium]
MRFERIVGGEGPPRLVGVKRVPQSPQRPARPEREREPEPTARRVRTDHGQEAPAARPDARHVRPASVVVVSALLSALVFGIFLVSDRGLLQVRKQRVQLAKAQDEVAQLEADTKRLTAEVAALKSDPNALEKVAREELNLVKPGEIVLVLPDGWEQRVKPASPASATPVPR